MSSKKANQKVGCLYIHSSVDASLSPKNLARILRAIAEEVLKEGKQFTPSDSMDIIVHFPLNSEENV